VTLGPFRTVITGKASSKGAVVFYGNEQERPAMTLTTIKQQIDNDMNNPDWNEEIEVSAARPSIAASFESTAVARPITEDELEAYRFRGAALRRPLAPAVPQPLPAPHPAHGNNGRAVGRHAAQVPPAPVTKVPETLPVP